MPGVLTSNISNHQLQNTLISAIYICLCQAFQCVLQLMMTYITYFQLAI